MIAKSVPDRISTERARIIAHADMDAFYASIEQLDDPALRGKELVVAGRGARGVVTSASYEARKYGVRAAMPTAEARRLCPQAVFVAGRMARYVEVSRVIRRVFESFTPDVEPLSLDEAFLDLTGTERVNGPSPVAAREIKRRVHQETGLVVSVGVAPTKMAAKILSQLSKPDGLLVIELGDLRALLDSLPVEWLWGVGRVTLKRLHEAKIRTIADLASRDAAWMRQRFGATGLHLYELASGRDPRKVIADWRRKSYGEENTFASDLAISALELKRALIAHSEAVARRLRADNARARTISLKLKLARPLGGGRYPLITRSFSPRLPTDDGAAISDIVIALLARIDAVHKVRLAGVTASDPVLEDTSQIGLFNKDIDSAAKTERLNQALDDLAKRFGASAVTRGQVHAERAALSTRVK